MPRKLADTVRYGGPYRALWSARTISFSGDTIAQVALVLVAAAQPHAAIAVGLLLVAQTVPRLLGPVAGIVADRASQRGLMLGCELGQAALVAALALLAWPFAVVLVLVAAMTLLATLFLPASQGALPALVAPARLGDANALLRLGFNVSQALGPALAALLLALSGVRLVLLLDALSFVVSAVLLSRLPALRPAARESAEHAGLVAVARHGLTYLARQPTVRAVTIGLFLVTLFVALDNVGLVFLARQSLHAGNAGYGLLLAGYGVGMVLAPLAVLRLAQRLDMATGLIVGITVMGLGTLLCGLAPALAVALLCQGVVGIGNGFQNVANDTLLQRSVPRAQLGRVFGVAYSVPYAALLITYAAGGLLLQLTSPRTVFVIAGAGTLASGMVVWLLLALPRHANQHARPRGMAGDPATLLDGDVGGDVGDGSGDEHGGAEQRAPSATSGPPASSESPTHAPAPPSGVKQALE
jgi:MFS family permease